MQGGTLCGHLLLQFHTILFEIFQVLMSWPEDMNAARIEFSGYALFIVSVL